MLFGLEKKRPAALKRTGRSKIDDRGVANYRRTIAKLVIGTDTMTSHHHVGRPLIHSQPFCTS
jgi:hypothetical protein